MDARTPDNLIEDRAAPAIVISASAQVGPNRTLSMQFGVPLDMMPKDLNAYVDKMMGIVDRQNDKALLIQAKLTLANAERDLQTNIEQHAASESKFRLDHTVSGRRGDWKPSESQRSQLVNWENNMRHLRETLIPKFRKDIAELEQKIAAGV